MSRHARGISPNPFEKGRPPGLTYPIKRSDFISPDAFVDIKGMPRELATAFRDYASESNIQGLAFVHDNGLDFRVIQELPEDPAIKTRISMHGIILLLTQSVHPHWVNMKGRPFEEVEEEIRREVVTKPDAFVIGIFRFID